MCKILSSKDYTMKDQTHVWFYEINERGKKSLLHGSAQCYCVDIKCLLHEWEMLNEREVNLKKNQLVFIVWVRCGRIWYEIELFNFRGFKVLGTKLEFIKFYLIK